MKCLPYCILKHHLFVGSDEREKILYKKINAVQIYFDIRNCDLRKNLDLRKIVAITKLSCLI